MEKTDNPYIIVYVTTDSFDNAQILAKHLVSKRLVACVNIIPKVCSVYKWKEEIVQSDEVILFLKTRKSLFDAVSEEVIALHPYECPCIVSIQIDKGTRNFFDWIEKAIK